MPYIRQRTVSAAFGIGVPQDAFLFKPSLSPFILCTNNHVKKIFISLTIFCQTLKAEEISRRIFTCQYRPDFKYIILCLFLCGSFLFWERLLNLLVGGEVLHSVV